MHKKSTWYVKIEMPATYHYVFIIVKLYFYSLIQQNNVQCDVHTRQSYTSDEEMAESSKQLSESYTGNLTPYNMFFIL